jgi:hypothetical protein
MKKTPLFGIGTRVKFLTTPDSGIIIEKLGDGMVMVALDGAGMDIPVFEEDLIRAEDYFERPPVTKDNQKPLEKPKMPSLSASRQRTPLEGLDSIQADFKPTLAHTGLTLAFEPIKKNTDEISHFVIWLLNDTPQDMIYELDFALGDYVSWSKDGLLKAVCFEKIGDLAFDNLNESPAFDISMKPVYTEGVGEEQFKTLKIRPKSFIKNYGLSPFLNKEVHAFSVFEKIGTAEKTEHDLKSYTQNLLKATKNKSRGSDDFRLFDPVPNVNEYASFVPEIDLHIEMLHENPQNLTTEAIVQIQIKAFESFLAKAIRLGISKIYLIHGVGKGRLRDMIAARLRRHPDVFTFKNEYHERYGFGATEVWLRQHG